MYAGERCRNESCVLGDDSLNPLRETVVEL